MKRIPGWVLLISLLLIGCNLQPETNVGKTEVRQEQANVDESPAENAGVSSEMPVEEAPVENTPEEKTEELSPSTEAVAVTFTAADGMALNGMYYPSVYMDAPVVVLMHQANMDLHQWDTIAPWLQNASEGQAGISSRHAAKMMQVEPWQDSSWFPVLPDDFSVSVFTFTFRGCEGGCSSFDPDGWLLDASAALEEAASMPEVDASRVVPVGTSIGADGAVDGCINLSADSGVNCLDAFSLSPGSYLGVEYAHAVKTAIGLGQEQNCFATEGDENSALTCRSVAMDGFSADVEAGMEHGIEMVNPEFPINILELLRDYLANEVL